MQMHRTFAVTAAAGVLALQLVAACSSGGANNPASPVTPTAVAPSITAQPQNAAVAAGQTATFTVTAAGTAPLLYQWRRSGNAIAGAVAASYTTAATSAADNGATFSVAVTNSAGAVSSNTAVLAVNAPLTITATSLPNGVVQSPYTATLQATGGETPYAWAIQSGQLPAGLALSASSGTITGTPTAAGSSAFTLRVQDASGATATLAASITISATVGGTSPFGHVVIVVEENANYASVVGSASMPYLNSLIKSYGLATQYYSRTNTVPSPTT